MSLSKTLFLVLICLLFSTLSIALLSSVTENDIHQKNNFIRLFPPHPFDSPHQIDLKYNSYYIAGATKETIYLANAVSSYHVVVASNTLEDTTHLKFTIDSKLHVAHGALVVNIDSPNVYMRESITPTIMHGNLTTLKMSPLLLKNITHYYTSIPISKSSIILRTYDSSLQTTLLSKFLLPKDKVSDTKQILEKQVDGLFCTEGMLTSDPETGRLIYLFYYRNQYLYLDSSLNLISKGKTIDTVSRAQIKIGTYSTATSKTRSLASPPLITNRKSCVFGNHLFINSGLMAANEDEKIFKEYSVIDVYTLSDGLYRFSFYIPDINEKKIKDFKIQNETLIILQDTYVSTYQLNTSLFNNSRL